MELYILSLFLFWNLEFFFLREVWELHYIKKKSWLYRMWSYEAKLKSFSIYSE